MIPGRVLGRQFWVRLFFLKGQENNNIFLIHMYYHFSRPIRDSLFCCYWCLPFPHNSVYSGRINTWAWAGQSEELMCASLSVCPYVTGTSSHQTANHRQQGENWQSHFIFPWFSSQLYFSGVTRCFLGHTNSLLLDFRDVEALWFGGVHCLALSLLSFFSVKLRVGGKERNNNGCSMSHLVYDELY